MKVGCGLIKLRRTLKKMKCLIEYKIVKNQLMMNKRNKNKV